MRQRGCSLLDIGIFGVAISLWARTRDRAVGQNVAFMDERQGLFPVTLARVVVGKAETAVTTGREYTMTCVAISPDVPPWRPAMPYKCARVLAHHDEVDFRGPLPLRGVSTLGYSLTDED